MRFFIILFAVLFAGVTFESTAQGNCNDEDLDYLAENIDFVLTVTQDCGIDCIFAGNQEACFNDCFSAQVPLSASCTDCFSAQTTCAEDNCLLTCAFGSSEACQACIEEFCLDDFNTCAGITDNDGDTFTSLSDCDDNDADVYPGAPEIWYDGVDQNCDGLNDFDQDGDGDPSADFGGTDCDDTDPNVFNNAPTWYADNDGDGFGNLFVSEVACTAPEGFVADNTDCDDNDPTAYPGAPSTSAGIDNDCNGTIDPDEILICVGDFNNDLVVGTQDLLQLLGEFGCQEDCSTNLDADPSINAGDLLAFLSAFGLICN